jgi:hypothetical protein
MKKSSLASSGFTTFGMAKRLKKRARDDCFPEFGDTPFSRSIHPV